MSQALREILTAQSSSLILKATCPYCEKYQENFVKHLQPNSNSQNSECYKCSLSIPNEDCVINHSIAVHEEAEITEKCEICKIDFSSSKHLKFHQDICHNSKTEKNIQCDICYETFLLEATKTFHMKTSHPEVEISDGWGNLKCYKCDQKFIDTRSRLKHIKNDHFCDLPLPDKVASVTH